MNLKNNTEQKRPDHKITNCTILAKQSMKTYKTKQCSEQWAGYHLGEGLSEGPRPGLSLDLTEDWCCRHTGAEFAKPHPSVYLQEVHFSGCISFSNTCKS